MTTEEMREAWNETSRRLDQLEKEYFGMRNEVIHSRKRTALQNLAQRYKRFSLLSIVFIFIAPFYGFNHLFEGWLSICIPISMVIFFGIASVMDWWLYKRVSGIDVTIMTNEKVVRESRLCRRRHFQFMAILFPLALGMVSLFVIGFKNEVWGIFSCAIGLVIGLAIGLRQLINFLNDYRMLRED